MSNREMAIEAVKRMDDSKIDEFLAVFVDENELARIETEMIMRDPNRKTYDNFGEILKEIEEEMALEDE